jgi:hypothetical protein
MQDQPDFQGSFSEGSGGEQRDHEGHLLRGSFGDGNCPECVELVNGHAQHKKGSFSDGSGGLARDEEGDLMKGSFAESACPICHAEATTAGS